MLQPLQPYSCCNLCNLNFDVIAEAADAACELGHDTAGIAASEVVGAKILVTSAVGQHVIGGLQDRCRDRDDGFLWTTPGLEPQVLRLGSVALPAARYDYNSDWTPLLAGLSPAGMAASLAALEWRSKTPNILAFSREAHVTMPTDASRQKSRKPRSSHASGAGLTACLSGTMCRRGCWTGGVWE